MPGTTKSATEWLVASNPRTYDADAAFKAHQEIVWSETASANINVGDTVLLYGTSPRCAITHECLVIERGLGFEHAAAYREFWGDALSLTDRQKRSWMRLRLVHTFNGAERAGLHLTALKQAGLKAAPQGRMRAIPGVLELVQRVRTGS